MQFKSDLLCQTIQKWFFNVSFLFITWFFFFIFFFNYIKFYDNFGYAIITI